MATYLIQIIYPKSIIIPQDQLDDINPNQEVAISWGVSFNVMSWNFPREFYLQRRKEKPQLWIWTVWGPWKLRVPCQSPSFFRFVCSITTNESEKGRGILQRFQNFSKSLPVVAGGGRCTFGYQVERKSNPAPNLLLFVFAHTPHPAQDGLGKDLIYQSWKQSWFWLQSCHKRAFHCIWEPAGGLVRRAEDLYLSLSHHRLIICHNLAEQVGRVGW